jgi:hypothetical protein
VNEAELFCSDLKFRISDEKITDRYVGDSSKNSEDTLLSCIECMQSLVKIFRAKVVN